MDQFFGCCEWLKVWFFFPTMGPVFLLCSFCTEKVAAVVIVIVLLPLHRRFTNHDARVFTHHNNDNRNRRSCILLLHRTPRPSPLVAIVATKADMSIAFPVDVDTRLFSISLQASPLTSTLWLTAKSNATKESNRSDPRGRVPCGRVGSSASIWLVPRIPTTNR